MDKYKNQIFIGIAILAVASLVLGGINYFKPQSDTLVGGTVKISDLTALTATPADNDVFPMVDTSATETKKIAWGYLYGGIINTMGLDYNPFKAGYFVATSTGTSTMHRLEIGDLIATPYIHSTSTTATSTFEYGININRSLLTAPYLHITTTTATSTFESSININRGLLTAPYLHITSTTATSTFEYGININGGCFARGGTCVSGGTVTSVAMSVPEGLSVAGSPITSAGTLAVSLDTGYFIPLISSYGLNPFVANYFIATSTSATSTFENLYAFGAGAYYFEATSSMVSKFANATTSLLTVGSAWLTYSSTTVASGDYGLYTTASTTYMTIGTGGYLDAGGAASFEIPSGSDPTVDAAGEIAINTSTSSLRYYDTAERAIYPDKDLTITISSSTLIASGNGVASTSTIPLGFASKHSETWITVTCVADKATGVDFGDGLNFMDYTACSTATTTTTFSTNNVFAGLEERYVRVKSTSGVNWITLYVNIRKNAD